MNASICTFSGIEFFPFAPRVEGISAVDIVSGLSQLARFGGQARRFFSVAQHSVAVSHECDAADAAYGLLHDASEAYLLDIPKPWKRLLLGYHEAESALQVMIYEAFGLDSVKALLMPPSVHAADLQALRLEQRDLMAETTWWEKTDDTYHMTWGSRRPLGWLEARGLMALRLIQLHRMGLIPRIPGGIDSLRDLAGVGAVA